MSEALPPEALPGEPAATVVLPLPEAPAAPAAVPAGPPSLPRLLAHSLLDVLLSGALLIALSVVLLMPVIAIELAGLPKGGDGAAPDIEAISAAAAMSPTGVVMAIVAMLLTAIAMWLLRGRALRDGRTPMPAGKAYALAAIAGAAIQGGCLGVAMLADKAGVPLAPSNAAPITEMSERLPWLAWFVVVVLAPLSEELLFRHVLLRRFAIAGRGLLGLLVTSLLFASMHELTPSAGGWATWLSTVSVYVLMGVGFGTVYLRTGRFGAAFAAHAACNLLAMVLLAFTAS